MSDFLLNLVQRDSKIAGFGSNEKLIENGLAPLVVKYKLSDSLKLQKSSLLEQAKLNNWLIKSKQLFDTFNEKTIRFITFKGFAFTHTIYQGSWLRPYSDIDVIVPESDYPEVSEILEGLGYKKLISRQGQYVSFQNSFFDNGTPQSVIDLHWQINNRIEFHKKFPFEELWKQAKEIDSGKSQFRVLCDIDAFILGCFHYQAHRPEHRKHIWLYDLALIWQNMSEFDKKQCLAKAKETGQLKIVSACLILLNEVFDNLFRLQEYDLQTEYENTEYYLASRKRKISDIKIRLQNIDGFGNKIKYLSEYVFQSRDYVKTRYQLKTTNWVFLYYPRMWLEDFFKLFRKSGS